MSQHSLDTEVNEALAALGSTMKGPGVPPAPLAGMLWLDDSATPWTLRLYDGTDWIPVGTVDASTNVFIADGLAAGRFFAPRANDTPNMKLRLNAGIVFDAVTGTLTGVDSQETATLTAPSSDPRRDLVTIDRLTGIISVVTGVEAASPADPIIPAGQLPVARINWTASATAITTGVIDDVRVLSALGLSFADVFSLSGFLTPPTITADEDDYDPSGLATVSTLRLSTDAAHSITGLAGGTPGRILIVHNIDTNNLTIENEHSGSSAGNRFALNGNITLAFNQAAILQYDHISDRWRAIAYQPTGVAPGGMSRSLRFNDDDTAYLNRAPAAAGNRRIWTWSGWVKIGNLATPGGYLLWAGSDSNNYTIIGAPNGSSSKIAVLQVTGGTTAWQYDTDAVFRDPAAWLHIVVHVNTAHATDISRSKLYVNGVEQSVTWNTSIMHNIETYVNSTLNHNIGGFNNGATAGFDGYMVDIHLIDGQALDASAFGEFDENGTWIPKKYEGTYGNNGFWLDFADNSGTTSTTLGKDRSGNNNDWTPNNFSVASGPGNDSLIDLPVNFDDGVNGRGNYCTLSPIIPVQASGVLGTYSNGNLDFQNTHGSTSAAAYGQLAVSSGKWYFEAVPTNGSTDVYPTIGVSSVTQLDTLLGVGNAQYAYRATGVKVTNASSSAYGNSFTTGDIVGVALDLDNGKVFFAKNGVWQNSGDPVAGTNAAFTSLSGSFVPGGLTYNSHSLTYNFGQRPFTYPAPEGFKALNTQNLPAPAIAKPAGYVKTVLYQGDGSSRDIDTVGFWPDLVWLKNRDDTDNHKLTDMERTATNALESNTANAQCADTGGLTAFLDTGFSLGSDPAYNTNGDDYVAWNWKTGVAPGFDILRYSGNSSAGHTVNHDLGVAPAFVIVKNYTGSSGDWAVWHQALVNTEVLKLNSPAGKLTDTSYWNSTTPDASVLTLGTNAAVNASTKDYVAYLWAEVLGFSKFGSYTGNGNADGPFVWCGFRPQWLMVKRDATESWLIVDAERNVYNVIGERLYADTTAAGASADRIDFLANGFKVRAATGEVNVSSSVCYFAAFAEHPFKTARAR